MQPSRIEAWSPESTITVSPGPRIVPSVPRFAWWPVVKTIASSVPIQSASSLSSSTCRSIVPFSKREPVRPGAVAVERVCARLRDALVAGQPEIVVGAEHDPRLALHLDDRQGRAFQHVEVGQRAEFPRCSQLLQPLVLARLREDISGRCHVGTHRNERAPDRTGRLPGPAARFRAARRPLVSDPHRTGRCGCQYSAMDDDDEVEVEVEVEVISVEAEVVEVDPAARALTRTERAEPVALPVMQAAALAATGFVAGAATVVLLRRHGLRKRARELRTLGDLGELRDASEASRRALAPGAGRTYLVNVRLISRP